MRIGPECCPLLLALTKLSHPLQIIPFALYNQSKENNDLRSRLRRDRYGH